MKREVLQYKQMVAKKSIALRIAAFLFLDFTITLMVVYSTAAIALCLSPVEPPEFDADPPTISILGDSHVTIRSGEEYVDAGVTIAGAAEDALLINGRVNTTAPANYLISYAVADDAGNVATASRVVTVLPANSGVIYLTFDDGPGPYTEELLDILAKYNVKATFFVTGTGSDDVLKREYDEGHAIGLHTYTHDYSYVYSSVDNFFADLYRIQERVKNVTGHTSFLMRFPGGSSNLVSARYDGGSRIMSTLTREVESRGFTYFDWNITSGDAGGTTDSNTVYHNVINRVYHDGKSVVLQHDIKSFSVAAVERIIKWGLENGFTFAKLDKASFTAHHGVNN